MQICFMRTFIKAPKFARLLAKTSKYYGIELVYCHPKDVNIEKEVIYGKVLENNKWVKKEVSIPPFIDLSSYCFKYKDVIDFLKKKSVLSCSGRFGSKEQVYSKLQEDEEFSHLLIPTKRMNSFDEFHSFLIDYKKVVIKPRNGQRGKGVYLVTLNKNDYTVSFENDERKLDSLSELKAFFEKEINPKSQIIQKYIQSKTKGRDPFDCRIRLEKNGKGRWEAVIYLIRIGSNQKVVSNVAMGGSVSSLTPFIKANYEQDWESIRDEILNIGETLPYKMETLFNSHCTSMGIDIGIDEKGDIFLFEVNSAPGVEFGEGVIANIKPDYYHFILKKLANKQGKDKIKPLTGIRNLLNRQRKIN